MEVLLKLIGGLSVIVCTTIFQGFTIKCFWAWYVAEPLHLPLFDIWHALGFSLLIGIFRQLPDKKKIDEPSDGFAYRISVQLVAYGIVWAFAGILNLFK